MDACPVCGVAVEPREAYRCQIPGCPCYGLRPDDPEAQQTAERHWLGISQSRRTWDGAAALEHLELLQQLEVQAVRGQLIDLAIEHRGLP